MAHRIVTDQLGRVWDVWETHPGPRSQVSPRYREGWLTFETTIKPSEKRRLAPIPLGWFTIDQFQLLALLDQAEEVDSGRRTTIVALEESSAPPLPPTSG